MLYGDYGSGKSMTLRDVYFKVRDQFASGKLIHCPIYLNLREHIAQTQPDEALYRHAEKIGFPEPHSLIAAWRAGFVTLFLESVREHHVGLHSFRNMSLMEARRRKASALRLRFSQSLASLRQRPSQAKVRSTIQRFGKTTKPLA